MAINVRSKIGYVNKTLPKLKEVVLANKRSTPETYFYDISYGDVEAGSRTLETMPADYFLKSITIIPDTPFDDDVQTTLYIGGAEALPAGVIVLNIAEPQEQVINKYYREAQSIVLSFTGSYNKGSAKVVIERQKRL
jgi:hypothetical protein